MKYSAIDLHSNNNVLVVTDETDRVLVGVVLFSVYWLRVSMLRIFVLPVVSVNFLFLRMTRPVMRGFVQKWRR